MKERSVDEMIAYFNRRVSEMDIAQEYKIELLGMVAALGYKHEKTARRWIPCSERLPERIINGDVETVQEFFVTVKERWPGEEWEYHTDVAEFPGDYIDDVWQTYNDWREGQEVHVVAWMPLPEPYREVE